MNRNDIYTKIDQERESQDSIWRKRTEVEGQYMYAAPHILLLEEQVAKLRSRWYGVRDESTIEERLIKVAAIAVRAIEEIQVKR